MDLATLIGAIAGLSIVSICIAHDSGGIAGLIGYLDWPAAMIVFGGCASAMLLTFNFKDFLAGCKSAKKCVFPNLPDAEAVIAQLVKCAEMARKDGILALESVVQQVQDEFLAQGLRLAIDGTDPEVIEKILSNKIEAMELRHHRGKMFWEVAGRYAPGFGMCGTLIGMIIMLQNLEDPKKIGKAMSLAMIATLYGALGANFFFLPLADKLSNLHKDEAVVRQIVIEGVVSIQAGDNPRIVEDKLRTFLKQAAPKAKA